VLAINTHYPTHQAMRLLFHVAAVFWLVTEGFSAVGLGVLAVTYLLGILSVTVGYHRYFSHRSFETHRLTQFLLGVAGCCQLQGGPIAWTAVHRHHHRHSDDEDDLHSPVHGLFHSHVGWLSRPRTYEVAFSDVRDWSRYKELVWLDHLNFLPPLLCFGALWGLGAAYQASVPGSIVDGPFLLFWGGIIRVVVVWHFTWSVNSICHRWGSTPFETGDTSKNNLWVALFTCGEGWHNNHHRYPSSARNGLKWSEPDLAFVVIRVLELTRVIWAVRRPNGQTGSRVG